MGTRTEPISRNTAFGSRKPRPFGLTRNPLSFLIRSIVPMKIVSFESGIRRGVEFFSSYFAGGRRDQRFALSPLERQPRKRREPMKRDYDLGKLRKRPGKVRIDPDAAKTPISIRLDGAVLADLRSEAERLGIPYQTLISSVLHRYVQGELVDPKAIDLGRIAERAS